MVPRRVGGAMAVITGATMNFALGQSVPFLDGLHEASVQSGAQAKSGSS